MNKVVTESASNSVTAHGIFNTNTIDVHGADPSLSNGSNWSEGYMTVNSEKYYEFGVAAGFITPLPEGTEIPRTNSAFKKTIKVDYYGENEIIPWGCMVIDRQFMAEEDRKVFFDEENGQENN